MPPVETSPGFIESLVNASVERAASLLRKREGYRTVAVTLLAVTGLLLLGTRYVPFALLPLAAALGAWIAVQRWRKEAPNTYKVARQIDEHAGLADQISTAIYFRSRPAKAVSARVVESQYGLAAESAHDVDPVRVFPDTVPVTRTVAVWLLGASVVFVGLRIAVPPQPSFEPPLATLLLHSVFGPAAEESPGLAQTARIDGAPLPPPPDPGEDPAPRSAASDNARDTPLPEEESEAPPYGSDEMPEADGLITLPLEEPETEGLMQEAEALAQQAEGRPEGPETPPDPGGDAWDEEAQGLLDKLKQAFENMLQTLDMANVESPDAAASEEQGSVASEESAAGGSPSDSETADEQSGREATDASMEGGEPGEQAGESASAGSTSGEDSSGEQPSGENASAAGSSDGSKELAEAEQLEVLGALEELYMERAENMRGEVTIETRLAEQSASVPYNRRSTSHSDSGGTISRDEIPAAYRAYIQNYFEALRKDSE